MNYIRNIIRIVLMIIQECTKNGIIRNTYCLKDVKKVIIWPVTTKGVTMYFNNGKLNLHPFLSNYEDIEKILKMNTVENIINNNN